MALQEDTLPPGWEDLDRYVATYILQLLQPRLLGCIRSEK